MKVKIRKIPQITIMKRGRYWIKKIVEGRNEPHYLLIKKHDGSPRSHWVDTRGYPVELDGHYKFLGPIPEDVYLPSM